MKKSNLWTGILAITLVFAMAITACGGGDDGGGGDNNTTVAVTGVTLNKTILTLNVGGTEKLTATVAPNNATNKAVTWSSSDTAKATVSTDGTVTAVAAGSATITVTTADGGKTATCSVDVNDPSLSTLNGTITISPTSAAVNTELTATYSGNEAVSFQWKKDGNNIGSASTTNPNKYTPPTAGDYTVTVSLSGYNSKTSNTVNVTSGSTGTNQTPVAADYNIGNLSQTPGSVTAVTITPKDGKSNGARTIYYAGTGGTTYAKSTTIPQAAGTYAVTFDVAAATGWNAATNLSAGTLNVILLFTSIDDFSTWLSAQPDNTAASPYVVALNVGYFDDASNEGSLGSVLLANPAKYVYLDLSGSTIDEIEYCFRTYGLPPSYSSQPCDTLTGIIIPNSITVINMHAFQNCTYLASVIIKDGGTNLKIRQQAFFGTSLTSIIIPDYVTDIEEDAFKNCENLTSVTFKGMISSTKFANNAFDGDLYDKFYATDKTNGTPGTYTKDEYWVWTMVNSGTPISYSTSPNSTSNTTAINFTFDAEVSGLTDSDIAITNGTGSVTKGSLSGSGKNWSLGITVNTAGNVTVSINKSGIESATKTVAVAKSTGGGGGNGNMVWTAVTQSVFTSSNDINAIAFGGGKFIAVGEGGKMAVSSDNGATWSAITQSVFSIGITAIAYGNGKFIAVGESGKMAVSTDSGATWTAVTQTTFSSNTIYTIAYLNGKFYAGTNGTMAYSSDGTTWTQVSNSQISSPITTIAFGDGTYVAGGWNNNMAYSSNGTTWTKITQNVFSSTDNIYAIAFVNGKFFAGSGSGKLALSSDGTEWTEVPQSVFGNYVGFKAIAIGNGTFVAVGDRGRMATSTDGTTWTAVSNTGFTFSSSDYTSAIRAIAYGNNTFIAGGSKGAMAYLSDN